MVAYALSELEVTDPEGIKAYLEAAPRTIAAHGGRYLVSTDQVEVNEGGMGEYPVKVVLEFPSMAAAKAWYDSPEYQAIRPLRRNNSNGNFVWVEGVE